MTETTDPVRPIGWPTALIGGALASAAALWLMFWFRSVFQIRTLPERALEYSLLFVPPDQFEAAVTRYGPDAIPRSPHMNCRAGMAARSRPSIDCCRR